MRRVALTFVHGVSNGPEARAHLAEDIKARLQKFGILDLFAVPNSSDHYVTAATWESVGDFFMDIAALQKEEWRNNAINTIGNKILNAQSRLLSEASLNNGELLPLHVVAMHSMGQPLGISAIADLTAQKKIILPTVAVSFGGPCGNRGPAFKSYLQWATGRISWFRPSSSLQVTDWIDIYNPDDPVCSDPALNLFGGGYAACRGVSKSLKFEWAGKPDLAHPLAEHSAYFEGRLLYETIENCIKTAKMPKKPLV